MILILMGPQGSGKGTIAEMLSDYIKLPTISVGQLLRDLPENHPQYIELHEYMDKGDLAPYKLTANLIKEKILEPEFSKGYILDGWARNIEQLDYFYPPFDKAIYLDISEDESIRRLSSRRTCSKCGDIYNIETIPPKIEGVCDECGGELIQREDDTPEAIRKRLEIFEEETMPVIEYFRRKGILLKIDGEPKPEVVFESVKRDLGV